MLSSLENLIYLTDAVLHRDFQLTKRPRTLRNETWFALLPFQEKKLVRQRVNAFQLFIHA